MGGQNAQTPEGGLQAQAVTDDARSNTRFQDSSSKGKDPKTKQNREQKWPGVLSGRGERRGRVTLGFGSCAQQMRSTHWMSALCCDEDTSLVCMGGFLGGRICMGEFVWERRGEKGCKGRGRRQPFYYGGVIVCGAEGASARQWPSRPQPAQLAQARYRTKLCGQAGPPAKKTSLPPTAYHLPPTHPGFLLGMYVQVGTPALWDWVPGTLCTLHSGLFASLPCLDLALYTHGRAHTHTRTHA